jgi:prenyltransferase beta subunit
MKKHATPVPIDWLLNGEPFVKYRTLIDLLDKDAAAKEVVAVGNLVPKHRLVRQLLAKQHKDGYWGTPDEIYKWWPKPDTTFWLLGVLADFGFRKDNRRIAGAGAYVLSTQHPSGGFGCGPPHKPYDCYTGILAESLTRLGYADDVRLKKAYDWLLRRQRADGGFWCKNTGQPGGPRESGPSCAFGSLCVLGAFAVNPALRDGTVTKTTVGFLLRCWDNRGKMKYAGHDSQIGTGWDKLKYPFTDYRILKYLDILSRFDLIKHDARMKAMASILMSKADEHGRFHAESVHRAWSDFDFGQKTSPSRWLTVIAHRIIKRCAS